MELYEKLLKSALKASDEQELPDVLLERIKLVCSSEKGEKPQLEVLCEMLDAYEPYADTGCGSETYSTRDVENLLKKIL